MLNKMTYDTNAALPDVALQIAHIAHQLNEKPLDNGESLFIENFPLEALPTLCSAIMAGYVTAIPTKADSVYGGAGVRIVHLGDLKNMAKSQINAAKQPINAPKPPIRKEGDWTATRNSVDVWYERIGKWFNNSLHDMAFVWNSDKRCVEVLTEQDNPNPVIPEHWYVIHNPVVAFSFMCDEGENYRAGKDAPQKQDAADYNPDNLNVWVGYKSCVWNYNEVTDTVQQFDNRSDADYHMNSVGIHGKFEDAPLLAYLGFKAAEIYRKGEVYYVPSATPAEPADEWGDL